MARARGFYVKVDESLSGHNTLFYGFAGGQNDAITTQRGALSFAKFLEKAAKEIRKDAKNISWK